MATNRPRYMISVDNEMFKAIENFRYERRYPTRSEATAELIRLGLETLKKEQKQATRIDAFSYRNNPDHLEPIAAHNDAELTEEELANMKKDLEAAKKKSAELGKKKKDDDI